MEVKRRTKTGYLTRHKCHIKVCESLVYMTVAVQPYRNAASSGLPLFTYLFSISTPWLSL
jgi:hypothetical protein